jgi:hypothetical protein
VNWTPPPVLAFVSKSNEHAGGRFANGALFVGIVCRWDCSFASRCEVELTDLRLLGSSRLNQGEWNRGVVIYDDGHVL